jgi:hypothetical protein
MITAQDGIPRPGTLEQNIKEQIAHRTRVQVQQLEVLVICDRVIIKGRVSCYYLKQLVLQGVRDAVGPTSSKRIELDVEVGCGDLCSNQGANGYSWPD